jgi:hypothetical protein
MTLRTGIIMRNSKPEVTSPAAAGPAAHFDRKESHVIYGTGHWPSNSEKRIDSFKVIPYVTYAICRAVDLHLLFM